MYIRRLFSRSVLSLIALALSIALAPTAWGQEPGDIEWTRQFGTSSFDQSKGINLVFPYTSRLTKETGIEEDAQQ